MGVPGLLFKREDARPFILHTDEIPAPLLREFHALAQSPDFGVAAIAVFALGVVVMHHHLDVCVLATCFIFPALLSDNLFCGWGAKLLLIQSGYRVLSVILMSVTMLYV